MLKTFAIFIFLFISFTSKAHALIKINEFSSPTSSDDWVEIYFEGEDTSLYQLVDTSDNTKNLSDGICSGNFCTVDWSNRLNNDGDTIKLRLISSPENVSDEISYGEGKTIAAPQSGQTAGRAPDGTGSWILLSEATKGSSNNSVTPAPSLTPTPTDIPDSPTPTKTPTPTHSTSSGQAKTPTPTKTPTLTPTKTPTPTKKLQEKEAGTKDLFIAGETKLALDKSPTPKENAQVLGQSTSKSPFIFIALGLIFITVCGILAYLQFGEKILIWKKKPL